MRHSLISIRVLLTLSLILALAAAGIASQEKQWDGSRTTPVHRFALLDETGETIVPSVPHAMPLSVRTTCGACHNYETIHGGRHFNASDPDAEAGRPGEPWVWVEPATGTQIPVSSRGWDGTWRPEALGLTPWQFTQLFGRHLPGGGPSEPEDDLADPDARWEVSGKAEINCLGCHSASSRQDQSEWAKQMARENFRWAATGASGIGDVGGMASRLANTWDVNDGRDPDDTAYAVPPSVRYDTAQFDSKGRAFLDIVRAPLDARCLHCHSVSPASSERAELDPDVHSAAGMACVDCHRNGLDHDMVRGDEATQEGHALASSLTCRGCHLGSEEDTEMAGRLGAPYPEHKGLPPLHLEKMSCTSCHSSTVSADGPTRVRTSRINRLGIHGRAQWFTETPHITEPVYVRGEDGKIAPHRLLWPAFWARLDGDDVIPIAPETIARVGEGILNAELQAGSALAPLQMALDALGAESNEPKLGGKAALLNNGVVYSRNMDGALEASDELQSALTNTTITLPALSWVREFDGRLMPLIEDFDPTTETLPYEIEGRVMRFLEAFAFDEATEGQPALAYGPRLFRLNFDGILESADHQGEAAKEMVWGRMRESGFVPLLSGMATDAIAATALREEALTQEQVLAVIERLQVDPEATVGQTDTEFAYIANGKMWRVGDGNALSSSEHAAAEPYVWALGHDVQPAVQALGAEGCTDCHATDAPFFFAPVAANGPLYLEEADTRPMHAFQDVDDRFQALFGWTFLFRPTLKCVMAIAMCLVGLILIAFFLPAVRNACLRLAQRRDS